MVSLSNLAKARAKLRSLDGFSAIIKHVSPENDPAMIIWASEAISNIAEDGFACLFSWLQI